MRTLFVTMLVSLWLVTACSSGKAPTPAPASNDPYYYDPYANGGGGVYTDPNAGYYGGITDVTSQMPQGSVAVIFGNVNTSQNPQFLGGITLPSDPNSVCTAQFSSLLRAFAQNYQDPPQLYQYDGYNYTFLDYVTDNPAFSPRFSPDQILSLCAF